MSKIHFKDWDSNTKIKSNRYNDVSTLVDYSKVIENLRSPGKIKSLLTSSSKPSGAVEGPFYRDCSLTAASMEKMRRERSMHKYRQDFEKAAKLTTEIQQRQQLVRDLNRLNGTHELSLRQLISLDIVELHKRLEKQKCNDRLHRAATTIQRCYRWYKKEQLGACTDILVDTAIRRIQRCWRASLARRRDQKEKEAKCLASALLVQRFLRGYLVRKVLEEPIMKRMLSVSLKRLEDSNNKVYGQLQPFLAYYWRKKLKRMREEKMR